MIEFPPVIYKYVNWDDHLARRILTDREMYFTGAERWKKYGEFDFDFIEPDPELLRQEMVRLAYQLRNSGDKEKYHRWFEGWVKQYNIEMGDISNYTWIELDLWEVRIIDLIIHHRVAEMLDNTSAYALSTKQFFFDHTGIYATSLVNDSPQLWAWKQYYKKAIPGNAVCVGLDLEKIKGALDAVGNYSLGFVDYKDVKNEVDFLASGDKMLVDRLNRITFTLKDDAVKDLPEQEELRILKFFAGDTLPEEPDRSLQLGNDFITEIIVHENANATTKEETRALANQLGCPFSISAVQIPDGTIDRNKERGG
jgi:hypothetical protein